MEKLEIQLGKEYMTRGGKKVIIYSTDKGGKHPVHGCVLLSDGTWGMQSWRLNGRYLLTDGDCSDIISELIETLEFDWDCLPKLADRFILMDDNGDWYCSNIEPIICDDGESWIGNGDLVSIEIPTSHAPKNYTGDWKESLHENPKYKK